MLTSSNKFLADYKGYMDSVDVLIRSMEAMLKENGVKMDSYHDEVASDHVMRIFSLIPELSSTALILIIAKLSIISYKNFQAVLTEGMVKQ